MAKGKVKSPHKRPSDAKKNTVKEDDILNNLSSVEQTGASSHGLPWRLVLIVAVVSIVIGICWSQYYSSPNSVPVSSPATKKATEVKKTKLTVSEIKKRTKTLPCKDRHDTNSCAQMAAQGSCDESVGWMTVMCAASCNRCELLDPKKRCSEENMNIKLENAYQPGDLHKMFETLQERTDSEIQVLTTKPWMVLVKNFITDKEISTLLKLTSKNLKRSTDQGEIGEDGFQEQVVSQHRTSSNAWCMQECEYHPIVQNLTQRIADLVLVPPDNFESFQVLRYELEQKYDIHHDASPHDFEMAAGPRVLTFFMYFSDVEEGGETHFPRMNISVKPEKGSALLWPSVLNDYPDSKIEQMTYHAALPVKKGTKYAANSWIHLRNYKVPNLWGCTGAFD